MSRINLRAGWLANSDEDLLVETLDWFSELLLRRPWHSVGVVIALNIAVVALWIAFEKRCDRCRAGRTPDDPD